MGRLRMGLPGAGPGARFRARASAWSQRCYFLLETHMFQLKYAKVKQREANKSEGGKKDTTKRNKTMANCLKMGPQHSSRHQYEPTNGCKITTEHEMNYVKINTVLYAVPRGTFHHNPTTAQAASHPPVSLLHQVAIWTLVIIPLSQSKL